MAPTGSHMASRAGSLPQLTGGTGNAVYGPPEVGWLGPHLTCFLLQRGSCVSFRVLERPRPSLQRGWPGGQGPAAADGRHVPGPPRAPHRSQQAYAGTVPGVAGWERLPKGAADTAHLLPEPQWPHGWPGHQVVKRPQYGVLGPPTGPWFQVLLLLRVGVPRGTRCYLQKCVERRTSPVRLPRILLRGRDQEHAGEPAPDRPGAEQEGRADICWLWTGQEQTLALLLAWFGTWSFPLAVWGTKSLILATVLMLLILTVSAPLPGGLPGSLHHPGGACGRGPGTALGCVAQLQPAVPCCKLLCKEPVPAWLQSRGCGDDPDPCVCSHGHHVCVCVCTHACGVPVRAAGGTVC